MKKELNFLKWMLLIYGTLIVVFRIFNSKYREHLKTVRDGEL